MNAGPSIGATEINAIARWIDQRLESGEAGAIREWFDARTIEEPAVIGQAIRYGSAAAEAVEEGEEMWGAYTSLFVLGFQLGIDAERRRRDAQELPA